MTVTVTEHAVDAELTAVVHELMPYSAVLGLRVVAMSQDAAVGVADWTPERTNGGGAAHGGFLMACADAVGALVGFANLPAGAAGTTTVESKTNFFRAGRGGTVSVRATPVHVGSTTVVVQTDVLDDRGRLLCRTTQTQLVLAGKAGHS